MNIERTLQVVCDAIICAEESTRSQIKKCDHDAGEEVITFLLHNRIKCHLQKASEEKHIQQAFFEDLKVALPYRAYSDFELQNRLRLESDGLIADMVLHNRREEGITGGDFGLVVVHPRIIRGYDSIEIRKGQSSGLLCQAKLKGKNNRWACLGRNQKRALEDRLGFTSLVLYSYSDAKRTELNPVEWKPCKGWSVAELDQSLTRGDFGELLKTSDIVMGLGMERIGTQDQNIIDSLIRLSSKQYFEIKIDWADDNDPNGVRNINTKRQRTDLRQLVHILQ